MKNLFFFLLGLLMITSASAAEYQYTPLVKDGKKWVDYYSDFENETGIICFQLIGETEINGITYHIYLPQLIATIYMLSQHPLLLLEKRTRRFMQL